MREFHYKLDEVLKLGYYEAHRLSMMGDELRSRDFEFDLIGFDYSQSNADYRTKVWEWVKSSQPRKYPNCGIPQHVINDLQKRMDEARKLNG